MIERAVPYQEELNRLLRDASKPPRSDIENENLFRYKKLFLEAQCSEAGIGKELNPMVFGIQFDYKFVWCPIRSTYSPNWAFDFLEEQIFYQPQVMKLLTRDRAELLNNSIAEGYVTVMIVREPFHRLVDAYLNQIQGSTAEVNKKIKCDILGLPYSSGNPTQCHPTFPSLVDYIISQVRKGEKLNELWAPYHKYCSVCALKWDYIIHYENLDEEGNFFLGKVRKHLSYEILQLNLTLQ